MREPPVRTEPHPTRRTSQTFLNCAPFGTDNDFNRPSGTGLPLWIDTRHFVPGYDRAVPPGRKPFSQAPGRVRLRPNRGFPLGLVRQRHTQILARMIDHFMPREQDLENSRVTHSLSYAEGRACRGRLND